MTTIRIEDPHDNMFTDQYVEEIVYTLLSRSLSEYRRTPQDVNMYAVRMVIADLQTAVDNVVIEAKRDYEEEEAEAEAFQRDPYAYNGVSRADFM